MARKLRTFVTVHERDEAGELTGRSGTFGPGDALPAWASAQITNPDVWEGSDEPEPATGDAEPSPARPRRSAAK